MNISTLSPPGSIAAHVDSILVIEDNTRTGSFILPLYANGSPTLVFQTSKGDRSGKSVGYLTLYGQTIRPEKLTLAPPFTLVAYFMRPHTMRALFCIQPGELTDGCADLGDIKAIRETGIIDQLLNEPSLTRRLDRLNLFIQSLTGDAGSINPVALFATQQLKANAHPAALGELQKTLNMSERSLQRLFESHVGISPKMYKRICQFNTAFQQLNQHNFSSLTEVAYRNGFADQSHYIRVFKEFTGTSPKEYIKASKPFNPKF